MPTLNGNLFVQLVGMTHGAHLLVTRYFFFSVQTKNLWMLTLESRRFLMLGEVSFCVRTLPNRFFKMFVASSGLYSFNTHYYFVHWYNQLHFLHTFILIYYYFIWSMLQSINPGIFACALVLSFCAKEALCYLCKRSVLTNLGWGWLNSLGWDWFKTFMFIYLQVCNY